MSTLGTVTPSPYHEIKQRLGSGEYTGPCLAALQKGTAHTVEHAGQERC